ncbi:transposase [Staphylococcus americanisciuri]|uniref:Transposase n=1 Tax=Staphylococcus americanisciuri TaxID=2973940 RepID=A0ABT2EYS4_9STAP|nr:transposase [Staphylococcus americanisciuri]MCS4485395.1 transposase [Staphylococcus americanisciuri]
MKDIAYSYQHSQLCHRQQMPLIKRIFKCEVCRNEIDRDLNASLNLVKLKEYVLLT